VSRAQFERRFRHNITRPLGYQQAVRVATRYALPLSSPVGAPAPRAAEQTQRSSSFPRPICSHGHRCACLTR